MILQFLCQPDYHQFARHIRDDIRLVNIGIENCIEH